MSKAIVDLRVALDESTNLWLDVEKAATGLDKQDIVRAVMKEWGKKKQHAYKVATKLLKANGLQPELFEDDVK